MGIIELLELGVELLSAAGDVTVGASSEARQNKSVHEVLSEIDNQLEPDIDTERLPSFAAGPVDATELDEIQPPGGVIAIKNCHHEEAVERQIQQTIPNWWGMVQIDSKEPFVNKWIVGREKSF